MARTWLVRLAASRLTLPVKSFHVPAAPGTWRANRYWVSIPLEAPRRRSLLVTADMLEGRDFRHLRLWALWRRLPGVAPGQLSG